MKALWQRYSRVWLVGFIAPTLRAHRYTQACSARRRVASLPTVTAFSD